jgi:probable rRNA maturation factor
MLHITVTNQQRTLAVDRRRIRRAVQAILKDHGIRQAEIGVAVVDDATIARLHGEFLADGTPTDVLSFLLTSGEGQLEGEVVVSAETAAAAAPRFRLAPADELLLYIIHGVLHLVGYDDAAPKPRAAMLRKQRAYLRQARSGNYQAHSNPSDSPSNPTPPPAS